MKAARNGWKAACWRLALLAGPLVLAVSVAAFPAAPAQAASKSLTISPAALPSGVAGQPYSATLTASGGKAPYTWSISTGGLPAGLSLSTSGDIVGTPTAAGTSSIKVKVTDSSSPVLSGTKKYTVRVTLGVSPATLPSGVVGQPYSESLTATGGTAPYTWTILSGALPTGLALSSGGAISGTPTKAAKSSVKVKVTDSTTPNALTATATYSVVVVIGVAPSTLPDGTVGSAYSQALTASGGKAPYTWNVTGGSLPAGLELSSAGEVSGTPTTAGTLSVTIGVTDSSSPAKTGSVTYAITVGNPLAVATQTLSDAWLGSAYSVQLVASGGQGSITWQITSGQLPPGLSLSSGGLLSGIPTAFGTSRFGVEASDSSIPPNTASADLSLSVTSSELTAGQSLTAGESLTSPSNLYHADMQSDGNFVVYPAGDNSSTGGAIWNSQTEGNPGDYVTLQTDGNLVIYPAGDNSTTGGALWNAGTEGNTNVTLTMQDDGNLVVYSEGGVALWSSVTGKLPNTQSSLGTGEELNAGQSLWSPSNLYHADMQSDGNFVVYPAGDNSSTGGAIWNSQTEGNPGDYLINQSDGNLVIYPAGDNSTTGGALWNAWTEGNTNVTLTMQDDGNLVVYSEGGVALWSSVTGKLPNTQSSLGTGEELNAGQSLWSPSNLYHADMQSDGNFVVYPAGDNSSTGGAIWNSQTEGNPGDYLINQSDGNLVIYPAGDNSTTGGALWNAGTEGNTNVTLTMQDDGNLVVYSSSGQALWSSMYGKSGGGYTGYPWLSASCVTGNNSECDTSSGPYAFDWGYTACPPSDTECMGYGQTITYDGTKWGMSDPWGYDLRNCTSYVAWYLVDEEGISASKVEGLGNAAQWEPNAHDEGVATGTARVGAVAWWNSNYGGGYGHVAIVTQVNSNGTVNTADYNQQETGEYGTETDQSPSGYIDF
jgi:CHAP domain/Putative Ig domain